MRPGWRGAMVMVMVFAPVAGLSAQAAAHGMMPEDSLGPAKVQLRGYMTTLRDSLSEVEAIHFRLVRARASRMTSVVQSMGRALGHECNSSSALLQTTAHNVGYMHTNDPHGDQALASYIASLNQLATSLQGCAHDDSLAMAARPPDPQRLDDIGAAASTAIASHNQVRDALAKLLGIQLPVRGTMSTAH